jgi:hypothetical protein
VLSIQLPRVNLERKQGRLLWWQNKMQTFNNLSKAAHRHYDVKERIQVEERLREIKYPLLTK